MECQNVFCYIDKLIDRQHNGVNKQKDGKVL